MAQPRHVGPVKDLADKDIDEVLQKYIDCTEENKWWDFGTYNEKPKGHAIDGRGLALLAPLLMPLLQAQPSARVKPRQLYDGLLRMFSKEAEKPQALRRNLLKGKNAQCLATFVWKRVDVVLYHVRRLSNDTRFRQASGSLSPEHSGKLLQYRWAFRRSGGHDSEASTHRHSIFQEKLEFFFFRTT